jgi:hypothetical protein|tara:strand:- start:1164 stop:1454 length:291 start_codon:yes stop_codon:yes gene_type:complete
VIKTFYFFTAVLMGGFFMSNANATIGCTPDDPAPILLEQHDEQPLAKGMSSRGAVITIYVSREGTWTIIAQPEEKVFCILDMGRRFGPVEIKKKRN